MPDIRDNRTVETIARIYCTNGRNKAQALEQSGYSHTYSYGQKGSKLFERDDVVEAINRFERKAMANSKFTPEQALKEYEEARQMALQHNNASAMAAATTGKCRLYGYDKDNSQAYDDQAIELEESQIQEAKRIAHIRLHGDKGQDKGQSANDKAKTA